MIYPHRSGKTLVAIEMAKFELARGKSIIFATADQQQTIAILSQHFPKALFEVIGDWGIKIHEKP